jgi:hypothetical protein
MYIDYGYSRPNVFSQGLYPQQTGAACAEGTMQSEPHSQPTPTPAEQPSEMLPMPTSQMERPLDSPVTSTAVLLPTQFESTASAVQPAMATNQPQSATPVQYVAPTLEPRLLEQGYEPTGNPLRQ